MNFNIEYNFWELNPEYKIVPVLSEFYKKDKTKNKEESSKIMNAIYLLHHKDSKFKDLPEKESIKLIRDGYLKDKDFKFENYKEIIVTFNNLTLTKSRRLLKSWEIKLEEREDFIASIKYDMETATVLDKLLSSSKSIWDQYLKILGEVSKEEGDGLVQGGATESLSDTGQI